MSCRPSITIIAAALAASVISGCMEQATVRSVGDLYRDAVKSTRAHQASDSAVMYSGRSVPDYEYGGNFTQNSENTSAAAPVIAAHEWDADDPIVAATQYELPVPVDGIPLTSSSEILKSKNGLITEYFEQTDLREAIEILASSAGQQVVIDEAVGGVVTAQISNATFEEALTRLLMPSGYVFGKHEQAYMVAPADPSSPLFHYVSERIHYEPRNRLASQLVEMLPSRFTDFYQISDDRNLIIIESPADIGREISQRLEELDQPVPQVVLEAIVCVTAPDSGFRFGMDWNHVLSLNSSDQVNAGISGLAFSAAASRYGIENAFDDFAVTSAFVQLLSQEGYVTIRAQPRVIAKDGEEATISINRETFFSLQPSSSNVLFRQDVQKVDAGITLQITPRIRGDRVSVEITRAEVSEDIRTSDARPELTNNPYPIINRRQVSTKVDVRDGHTIVIGGLVQRQTVDRINKVPVLGSIPLVGNFFKTVEKQEQDAEVAIFISPRIVTEF